MNASGGWKGKPRNRPFSIENNLEITGGEVDRGWVKQGLGIKEDT